MSEAGAIVALRCTGRWRGVVDIYMMCYWEAAADGKDSERKGVGGQVVGLDRGSV